MDDFEEGFSDTLIDDRSTSRDLARELVDSLSDTGNSYEEQVDALAHAIATISDMDPILLDRVYRILS